MSAIAIQQCLREMGYSYRQVASFTHVHPRTVWQHCNRDVQRGGSGKLWSRRSYNERETVTQHLRRLGY